MLNKTKIVLSALLVAGFTSGAFASSAVSDNWVGAADQPTTISAPAFASAFASAVVSHPAKSFTAQEKALFDRTSASGLQ